MKKLLLAVFSACVFCHACFHPLPPAEQTAMIPKPAQTKIYNRSSGLPWYIPAAAGTFAIITLTADACLDRDSAQFVFRNYICIAAIMSFYITPILVVISALSYWTRWKQNKNIERDIKSGFNVVINETDAAETAATMMNRMHC